MAKGYTGISPAERGFISIERDINRLRKEGRKTFSSAEEQEAEVRRLGTWEGKYPGFGAWEKALLEEMSKLRISVDYVGEVYPRRNWREGFEKKTLPKDYAKFLKEKIGW